MPRAASTTSVVDSDAVGKQDDVAEKLEPSRTSQRAETPRPTTEATA
jgi:hypothetical protein